MERKLAAIMLTDMVGYSHLMSLDEEGTIARQKFHRSDLIDPIIITHGGRIVKSTGDGLLVEFASVVQAVQCALKIQAAVEAYEGRSAAAGKIAYRIGVNLGDVVVDDDDIVGEGVNVAARLEPLALPGGVCISGAVFDQIQGRIQCAVEDVGTKTLKNIERPVRVYRLGLASSTDNGDPINDAMPNSTIGVLPFVNQSDDPDQEYFADGITEDIISALSNVRTFSVLARGSTFSYKGKRATAQEIGERLGVNYVVEGSVRRAGNRIRVTAQLADTKSGDQLWAERYDGELEDIFDLQDRITATIVGTIEPELVRAEGLRLQSARLDNLGAYDRLLRGLAHMHKVTPEDTEKALDFFQQSIELDPGYGRAYAFASWCFRRRVEQYGLDTLTNDERARAIELARSALRCDRDDPFVLAYSASTLAQIEGSYEEAISLTDRALSLNPNSHRFWNGKALWHSRIGETAEAIKAAERAISISPNNPAIWNSYLSLAEANIQELRYTEALKSAKLAIQHNEQSGAAYAIIAASSWHLGMTDNAEKAIASLKRLAPYVSLNNFVDLYQLSRLKNLDKYVDGLRNAGLEE